MSSPSCPKAGPPAHALLWRLPFAALNPPRSPFVDLAARKHVSYSVPFLYRRRDGEGGPTGAGKAKSRPPQQQDEGGPMCNRHTWLSLLGSTHFIHTNIQQQLRWALRTCSWSGRRPWRGASPSTWPPSSSGPLSSTRPFVSWGLIGGLIAHYLFLVPGKWRRPWRGGSSATSRSASSRASLPPRPRPSSMGMHIHSPPAPPPVNQIIN